MVWLELSLLSMDQVCPHLGAQRPLQKFPSPVPDSASPHPLWKSRRNSQKCQHSPVGTTCSLSPGQGHSGGCGLRTSGTLTLLETGNLLSSAVQVTLLMPPQQEQPRRPKKCCGLWVLLPELTFPMSNVSFPTSYAPAP